VAVWALGGFYLSLGPSLAAQLSGSHNLLWGGVITFLLTGLGAVTSSVFRNSAPPAVMLGGCLGLLGGAVVTVAAIVASTPALLLLLLGTVIAGLSFGPGNLGAYRVIMARAASSDRAGLIAAISTVNYLAFGLPALIAGIATSHFGLHDTALAYSVVIALLAVAAAAGFLFEGNARTRAPRAVAPSSRTAAGPVHRATVHPSSAPGSQANQDIQVIIFTNLSRPSALTASLNWYRANLAPRMPGRHPNFPGARPRAWHLAHRGSLPGRQADGQVRRVRPGATALRGDRGREPLDPAGRTRPAQRAPPPLAARNGHGSSLAIRDTKSPRCA
jgi:MFS family permease